MTSLSQLRALPLPAEGWRWSLFITPCQRQPAVSRFVARLPSLAGCCYGLNRIKPKKVGQMRLNAKFSTVTLQVLYNKINHLSC